MNFILWLISLSLCLGFGGLMLFLWAVRNGQYEDLEGSANRILHDD